MRHLLRWIGIALGALALAIVLTNLLVHLVSAPFIYNDAAKAPTAEAVLVPGAALVDSHTPAPIFIDRANTAIALYKAGAVNKILISGDNTTVQHNEVNPMRTYLLSQGIPDRDIFLDHAGLDTYTSMYRAKVIFGATSLLIASQSFHLPRAVFIARMLGLRAYGVNADTGHILLGNYIREIFSDEKALYDVVFHIKPAILGDPIPLTGDGRAYP